MTTRIPTLLLASVVAAGCTTTYLAPDRAAGDRAPLTRSCDETDPTLCLMPFPNSAFMEVDEGTETGLRLAVDVTQVSDRDNNEILRRSDGFSRVSSVLTGFDGELDASTVGAESFRVVVAQEGDAAYGTEAEVRYEVVQSDSDEPRVGTVVLAHPLRPMMAATDYVAFVTNGVTDAAGMPLVANRETQVRLGLSPAITQAEADDFGYHAPTRALLTAQGVDPATVVRVWDFTTRSEEDPRNRLRAMREAAIAAVENDEVEVVIETVEHFEEGDVASIIRGHLNGLPNYLVDRELSVDADGNPLAVGSHEAPFRVMIPRGEGDYRMLMFGHGTGGSVDDDSFDTTIASRGAAKVSIEFYAWTERTVVDTFLDLRTLMTGASIAAAGLMQAIADGSAIRLAMAGVIGDAIAADELGGMPNPNAGRRPDDSVPIWVGGSLGGTMGLLYAATNPEVRYAVLNVAGAAWGTWVRDAYQYSLLEVFIQRGNAGSLGVTMMMSAAQTILDEADGASWTEVIEADPIVALVQESIGDPVLPNPGTHVVARILGATQVGEPLFTIDGLPQAESVTEQSALTQYWLPGDDPLDLHGFADRGGPAGDAARAQILQFVESAWTESAEIGVPEGCPAMSCDFTGM
ncbi:MAG: hypothetical protein AB8I08_18470 [Sandaracinaceae bacterium]